MTRARRLTALLLSIAGAPAVFATLAGAQSDRARQLGGKFMCMCGCHQVLSQCNHVGCTVSTSMLRELDQHVSRGDSESLITQAFVQEFGTEVYAEPPKSGLSLIAWLMPGFYLLAGTMLVIFVIWRWRPGSRLRPAAAGVPSEITPESVERARQRVARETED